MFLVKLGWKCCHQIPFIQSQYKALRSPTVFYNKNIALNFVYPAFPQFPPK